MSWYEKFADESSDTSDIDSDEEWGQFVVIDEENI